MYLDIKKFGRVVGYILGILALVFGVVTFALSVTVQDQIAGTLAAIFGVQLWWFAVWLGRSAKPRVVVEARRKPSRG